MDHNYSRLLVSTFTYFTSFSAGIFYALSLPSSDIKAVTEPLKTLVAGSGMMTFPSFLISLCLLLLIFLLGMSPKTSYFAVVPAAAKALACGAGAVFILMNMTAQSFAGLRFSFIISCSITSVIFTLALYFAITGTPPERRECRNHYYIIFAALSASLTASALLEKLIFTLI